MVKNLMQIIIVVVDFEMFKVEVFYDYRFVCLSWEVFFFGWCEVLIGKVKFGIFGDGKELV